MIQLKLFEEGTFLSENIDAANKWIEKHSKNNDEFIADIKEIKIAETMHGTKKDIFIVYDKRDTMKKLR